MHREAWVTSSRRLLAERPAGAADLAWWLEAAHGLLAAAPEAEPELTEHLVAAAAEATRALPAAARRAGYRVAEVVSGPAADGRGFLRAVRYAPGKAP